MNDDPRSIMERMRELIARSTREQTRAMQRFGDLLRRAASGEIDRSDAAKEYVRLLGKEATSYFGDLVRLGIRSYGSLLELNRSYTDHFFDRMLGVPTDETSVPATDGPPSQRIAIDLSAAPDKEAVRSFAIENKRNETVDVSFLVSEFRSMDGLASFRPTLQFEPSRFELRPGEERVVALRLLLSGELFAPGQRYTATVSVGGYDELALAVTAWAEALPAADDLTRLRGIGSGYAERLHEAGIATFARLAATDDRELAQALGDAALPRARRDQWIAQARLAADGKEDELEALQGTLGSRESSLGESEGR